MSERAHKSVFNTTLLVVGLGYFIDCFDLFLYNALRTPSLRDLGLDGDAITKTGIWILNIQVIGMLIGGLMWGIIGDKVGRKKALIGSVLVYSLGSLGCAFVYDVNIYAILRFLTGIGLAGEIGLGAILVTETIPDRKRDWGLMAYALFAYFGIMAANLMAQYVSWRYCYAIGGAVGLLLLMARMVLFESGLYEKLAKIKVPRGSIKLLFKKPDLLKRYICCIFFAMPYYYMVNLLITFSPEIAKALGIAEPIKANIAIFIYSAAALIGTVLATLASRALQKRVMALALFMSINAALAACYLTQHQPSATSFYILCGIMGAFNFYVLLLFTAVEQFGTNMRATGGTSSLSIGRSTLVITTSVFLAFRGAGYDVLSSAALVGGIVFAIGFICLLGLRETYHQGMDFLEET
ncbi:MAG: MFS transporter [Alphaproteobacteria bacterium]